VRRNDPRGSLLEGSAGRNDRRDSFNNRPLNTSNFRVEKGDRKATERRMEKESLIKGNLTTADPYYDLGRENAGKKEKKRGRSYL